MRSLLRSTLLALALVAPLHAIEPPAPAPTASEQANDDFIYETFTNHTHDGNRSRRPKDFVPQAGSTYDLGSSAVPWAEVHADTATLAALVVSTRSAVAMADGNGHGSTGTRIRRFTSSALQVGSDITYADSATNGATFTVNKAGWYAISYLDGWSAGVSFFGVSVNAASLTTSIQDLSIGDGKRIFGVHPSGYIGSTAVTLHLATGDVVRAHTDGSPNLTSNNVFFRIERIQP